MFHPDEEPEEEPKSSINDPTSDDDEESVEVVLSEVYIGEEAVEVVDCDREDEICVFEIRLASVRTVDASPEDVDEL